MATFNCNGIDDLMLSMAEIAAIPESVQDDANVGPISRGVVGTKIKRQRLRRAPDGRDARQYKAHKK